MDALLTSEIVQATQGILLRGKSDDELIGVSIDSRTIRQGEVFFALKGERDGHDYIGTAVERGASAVVVSKDTAVTKKVSIPVIRVEDTLWALGELAGYYRRKFDVCVIGITGSVGKTTTKEMLASILSKKWKVLKNDANLNNEIGLPLTLFGLDRSHEVSVLEMGMRGLGEIRRLAKIAKPDIGVVTNVGMSHIERLGSQGSIAEAKSELLSELPPDGIAVLNHEDGYFTILRNRFYGRVVSFASCPGADVVADKIKSSETGCYSFMLLANDDSIEVKLRQLGHHNVSNALAAAAVGAAMGLDLHTIRSGLESATLPAMRMDIVKADNGCTILNDAYNANPAAMSAALRTLRGLKGYNRRIAVLGDMLELGDYAENAHRNIGAAVVNCKIDMLVTVGDLGRLIADGAKTAGLTDGAIESYSDSEEAAQALRGRFSDGDAVLVKGSRGMKMEVVVKALEND